MPTYRAIQLKGKGGLDQLQEIELAGRRGIFSGITALYRKNKGPFKEDLPKLFELLAARRIQPRIAARLPLLAGREAERLLEAGGINGKIVLMR